MGPTFQKHINMTLVAIENITTIPEGKEWAGLCTHLQDVDIGNAIRAVSAAVHLDVFEPLDVRLSVAVNLTVKLHIAAH